MGIGLVLIILGVALWLALMGLAVVLPLRPGVLRITRKIVCPPGCEIRVGTSVASYHRPGERGLFVECVDPNGDSKLITNKAVAVFTGLLFLTALPISAMGVFLVHFWVR